jgi:hypothetical protein
VQQQAQTFHLHRREDAVEELEEVARGDDLALKGVAELRPLLEEKWAVETPASDGRADRSRHRSV